MLSARLCVFLAAAASPLLPASALDPPTWPVAFEAAVQETAGLPPLATVTTGGYYWYDSGAGKARLDREDGRGDRYCGAAKPLRKTACSHVVAGGVRYLVFPELHECCRCCDAAHGCGIVARGWAQGGTLVGPSASQGVNATEWSVPGLQSNLYWEEAGPSRAPLRLLQKPESDMLFLAGEFKPVGAVDPAVFELPPGGCESQCGGTCRAVGRPLGRGERLRGAAGVWVEVSPKGWASRGSVLVYAACAGSASLVVVDGSDPGAMAVVGAVAEESQLAGARAVAVRGGYAFVAAETHSRLVSVDVRDPSSPRLVSLVQLSSALGVSLGPGQLVYVAGGSNRRVTAVAATPGGQLSKAGSVKDSRLEGCSSVAAAGRDGEHVVAAASADGGTLAVVNATAPAAPRILAALKAAGRITDEEKGWSPIGQKSLAGARGVAVRGQYAYVAAERGSAEGGGATQAGALAAVDLSDPAKPTVRGELWGDDALEGVSRVAAPAGSDLVLALAPGAGRLVVVGEARGQHRRRLYEL